MSVAFGFWTSAAASGHYVQRRLFRLCHIRVEIGRAERLHCPPDLQCYCTRAVLYSSYFCEHISDGMGDNPSWVSHPVLFCCRSTNEKWILSQRRHHFVTRYNGRATGERAWHRQNK